MLLFLRRRQGGPTTPISTRSSSSRSSRRRVIRTESHVARCLRIVTEAKVFEIERKARRHAGGEVFDDEVQYPSVFGASTHTKVAASEVLDIIEAEGGPELREVMFATCALDDTVAECVARVHARKTPAARAAIADRLRRQRINVLQKLNARVQRKGRNARRLVRRMKPITIEATSTIRSTRSIKEVPIMTTKKTVSHASHSHASHAETLDVSTPAEVAPHATTHVTTTAAAPASAAPAASSSATSASSLPPIDLAAPPANALIPPVPSDYVSKSGATYRNVSPKKTELLVLAQAVKNLALFTSYTQVMGTSAPSYQETLALFTVVN